MNGPLPQKPSRSPARVGRRVVLALGLALALSASACKAHKQIPPADPEGKDLVSGAIVAAAESSGGIRLYKITQVDPIPKPGGDEFHMVAYDPKASSWEEAAELWRDKKLTIALPHMLVRKVLFITRDHRVVGTEAVTPDEKLTIMKSQR